MAQRINDLNLEQEIGLKYRSRLVKLIVTSDLKRPW